VPHVCRRASKTLVSGDHSARSLNVASCAIQLKAIFGRQCPSNKSLYRDTDDPLHITLPTRPDFNFAETKDARVTEQANLSNIFDEQSWGRAIAKQSDPTPREGSKVLD
jgi:hypothetical protein